MRRSLVVVAVIGCGGSTPKAPTVTIDVAPINAAVPANLRSAIVFEQRDLDIEIDGVTTRYTMAVPTTFKIMPWIKPSQANQITKLGDLDKGFLEVGARCDGTCGLRDWPAVIDEVFSTIGDDQEVEVVSDSARIEASTKTHARLLVARIPSARKTIVAQASWIEGADRYWFCRFSLAEDWQGAAPAFVKACETVHRTGAPPVISTAKPPPNFIDVPGHPGIEIHVPDGAKGGVLRGAATMASFERPDDLLFIVERKWETAGDLETYKSDARDVAAWISERALADGWVVTYKADQIVEDQRDHGVIVQRTIGDETYRCGGYVKREHIDLVIAACTSLRPKP